MNEEYNEEYISNLYNNNGGSKTFGSYNKFKELISQNDKYRHKVHTTIGETLGSYDDFVGNLKKKQLRNPHLFRIQVLLYRLENIIAELLRKSLLLLK